MFSWLTRSGIFKDEQFEDDKEKLAEFYRKEGYIDFELLDVRIVNPTPRTMTIQFVVSEGNQYRVGGVAFKGNLLFGTNEIFAGLKLQHERNKSKTKIGPHGLEADVGMIFKPDSFDNDIKGIEDFYGARGYIDVKRGGNLRARRIPNTKTGTMDLEYNIDSGQKSYIEKIVIKGNAKTKDRVIRRELAVSPGEVFDMVRVRLSKERLEGLDYFEKVDTKNEPTVVPERKDLVIGVDEKSTGQFTFGAGFNTVDSLLGYVELEQRNFDLFKPPYFTGGGEKFRLRVQLGFERQDYLADFVEPWFLNRKLTLSVSLYRSVLNFQSLNSLYDVTRTGVRVGLSRALGSDFLIGGVGVNLEDVGINNVNTNAPDAILRDAGSKVLERFSASLAYDTRNSTGLSTKGQRTELLGEITTGDRTFLKTELKSEWYFKGFAEGHVIEIGGKAGVAQRLGNQDVPFYDRYYLGGQYDLRGFDYRAVGPRAVSQDGAYFEPIGGDTYWLGSIEYSIPIIPRLRFALFYDIGNVSARPWSNSGYPVQGRGLIASPPFSIVGPSGTVGSTGDFSDNYGIGLRLNLPIAPLRLDYGIPLTHDQFSSGSGKFQFSVGFSRPF
jgi:outer membrane protein insertion porin family